MAGADTGVLELPYKASTAITKLRFVQITGDQTVGAITASTHRPIGVAKVSIAQATTEPDKATAVQVLGVAWVENGGTCTRGGRVMPSTEGKAIDATGSGNIPAGVALKGSTTAGDWIPVLLTPGQPAIP